MCAFGLVAFLVFCAICECRDILCCGVEVGECLVCFGRRR
jgi:hypothetical protein